MEKNENIENKKRGTSKKTAIIIACVCGGVFFLFMICMFILPLAFVTFTAKKVAPDIKNKVQEIIDKGEEKSSIVFYERDKAISSFNCDGICEVYAFGEYPDDGMNEPIKQSDYKYVNTAIDNGLENVSKKERLIDLTNSDYVLIAYCQKDLCDYISTYVSSNFGTDDEKIATNSGKIVLYNVKTGKSEEISDIFSVEFFDNKTFMLSSISKVIQVDEFNNNYEFNYTLVFNDGSYRKLENEIVNDWCWEAPCSALTIDDNVVSKNPKGKYGIENIKTGKEIVEHKYEQISSVSNNYFAQALEKYEGVYLLAKENAKTNLYEYDGFLKQITKNGYDSIYIINSKTLFVYKDNNFYFIDMQENVLSNKVNINMKSFERQPHEASVMFQKVDNNSLYVKISPDLNGSDAKDTTFYYKYDLKTKRFEKVNESVWKSEN